MLRFSKSFAKSLLRRRNNRTVLSKCSIDRYVEALHLTGYTVFYAEETPFQSPHDHDHSVGH